AIVIVVAVVGVGGALMALKYWSTAPALAEPEVQVVYEKGGMYSEGGGEYSGADTSGRDIMDSSAPDGVETGDLNEPQPPEEGGPADQPHPEPMERTNVEVRDDIDLDRGPDLSSEPNEQLEQDVEIRTEGSTGSNRHTGTPRQCINTDQSIKTIQPPRGLRGHRI
ncbi:MAG: hypothetical protein KAS77_04955, partial [Thermoplasmata archaeon]|nr:hypothetical protein [Thermoplasmata archaeon]